MQHTCTIKNLYVENERVVLEGRWEEGFVAIVAVGATNVSSVRVLMMGIFVIELLIIEALQVLMLLSFSATIVFISVRNRKRGNDFCGVHSLAHYVSQCRLIADSIVAAASPFLMSPPPRQGCGHVLR
ncbi:uncharacterized protein [Lolium perenne]|uniref:uncharacterized protein n=1 Tax=Lolium perenne TaxID=4522 RepID=UPI003A99038A